MALVRLIYTSTITDVFKVSDIADILKAARANNAATNITGLLSFNRRYFLQCLEGERDEVNKMYHHIATDPRHTKPVIIDYQAIADTEFEIWSMGYLQDVESLRKLFYKHTKNANFDPYKMDSESAKALLLDIRYEIKQAEKA